jgi:hypothetical protein
VLRAPLPPLDPAYTISLEHVPRDLDRCLGAPHAIEIRAMFVVTPDGEASELGPITTSTDVPGARECFADALARAEFPHGGRVGLAVAIAWPDDTVHARVVALDDVVTGSIVRWPRSIADCGMFEVWSDVEIAPDLADSATLHVLVPCVELARGDYAREDADADRLELGARYRFELAWRDGSWRAVHIHAP